MTISPELRRRILPALILTVLAVAAVGTGGWITAIWVACAAGIMTWELSRLELAERYTHYVGGLAFLSAAVPVLAFHVAPVVAVIVAIAGLLALSTLSRPGMILPVGALMLCVGGILFVWFRELPSGLLIAFWVPLVTAFTDMGGYFVGRKFGRTKLAPSISPKKTVEGAIGGIAAAAIASAIFAIFTGGSFWLVPFAIVTGVAVSLGDLVASWVKRKTGVKDSGKLIPGHGGLIDRFDGLAGATLFVGGALALIPALRGLW